MVTPPARVAGSAPFRSLINLSSDPALCRIPYCPSLNTVVGHHPSLAAQLILQKPIHPGENSDTGSVPIQDLLWRQTNGPLADRAGAPNASADVPFPPHPWLQTSGPLADRVGAPNASADVPQNAPPHPSSFLPNGSLTGSTVNTSTAVTDAPPDLWSVLENFDHSTLPLVIALPCCRANYSDRDDIWSEGGMGFGGRSDECVWTVVHAIFWVELYCQFPTPKFFVIFSLSQNPHVLVAFSHVYPRPNFRLSIFRPRQNYFIIRIGGTLPHLSVVLNPIVVASILFSCWFV